MLIEIPLNSQMFIEMYELSLQMRVFYERLTKSKLLKVLIYTRVC